MTRYAILTNPVSGKSSVDQKRSLLTGASEILNSEIHGLDTASPEDFKNCARELADHCDVLVIAGGDGTVSDVINAVDTERTAVAFLPLGSGNAMGYALGYRGNLAAIATRIRDGRIHEYDLVHCDKKQRAFMASVGIEGTVLRYRDQYLSQGATGFKVYLKAFLASYFGGYKRPNAEIVIDDSMFTVKRLLTLAVVKQPYYGYGMKIVPNACFDDGNLHILSVNSNMISTFLGAAASFAFDNPIGQYYTGLRLTVNLEHPLVLQMDGSAGWTSKRFTFDVLPRALKIKC